MYDVTRPNREPSRRGPNKGPDKAAPKLERDAPLGPGERVGRTVADKMAESIERAAAKQERVLGRAEQKKAQLERQAEKHERAAARMADTIDKLDRLTAHLEAMDVWTRTEPAARKPRFTRDDIARAAVRLADDEGFEALSMRNLAAALGAGTMTIYHYVRTKDELLALVNDAVMGEVALGPDESLPEGWRDALGVVARRSRDAVLRHPWMLDMPAVPQFGPNSVRHFDQTLQAVSSLPLPLGERLEIASAVDEFVFGYCLNARGQLPLKASEPESAVVAYVEGLLASGHYPTLQASADEIGSDEMWAIVQDVFADPARFDRGLGLILDGVEVRLSRASSEPPRPPSATRAPGPAARTRRSSGPR